MATVKNGQHIVVKRARDFRLQFVKAGTIGSIGKVKYDFNDVIDRNFGQTYEVRQKKLYPYTSRMNLEEEILEDHSKMDIDSTINEEDESIKKDEIDEATASNNHESLTKLVTDSVSFKRKSAYQKEKYLTKRAKKHSAIITIYQPTIRLIHEIYYLKDADKLSYLRQDSLAHLLTWSNVHHGCRMAVIEQCLGIVTAAVLERMAGNGQCIRLHKGASLQSIPCMLAMDLDDKILAPLLPVPLDDFLNLNDGTTADDGEEVQDGKIEIEEKKTDEDEGGKSAKREQRESQKSIGLQLLKDANLDSFIIAVKEHPLPLLKKLLQSTQPSRPFVIYCTYVQPLLECYQWLRDEEKALNVRLSDHFYRKHQILPGRSHPEMNQPVAGGYILNGMTII